MHLIDLSGVAPQHAMHLHALTWAGLHVTPPVSLQRWLFRA